MNKFKLIFATALLGVLLFFGSAFTMKAYAASDVEGESIAEEAEAAPDSGTDKARAIAAACVVGGVAAVGAISMSLAVCKSTDSMARQPEAADKINSAMMLGLVFIETAIIYALIVAILIIFVL